MKKTLLFTKKINTLIALLALLFCAYSSYSQQVIGEFTQVDGGMESQTADNTMSSQGSSASGTPSTIWSVSSTGNSAVRTMDDDASLARTGTFSAAWAVLAGKTNVRMQSPTPTAPAFQTDTEYTIQFFYKTAVDPGNDLDPGIYLNNTSGGSTTNKTDVNTFEPNKWIKAYGTKTTGSSFNASNWAVVRISTTSSGGYNSTVRIDDFVVYAGGYDDTAPDVSTAGSISNNSGTATVSWTAPASGVDNGGYVVFKYSTQPNADNDPNQNGIYKVGSTTTNGTGGLTGTVAYIGTATTFNETYSAGTYYKVYTVDKAFNYSDELLISESTASVDDVFASKIAIYPNPANEFVKISSSVAIDKVEVFNLLGKKVLSSSKLNDNLDISSLSKGVYMIKLTSGNSVASKKLIKK